MNLYWSIKGKKIGLVNPIQLNTIEVMNKAQVTAILFVLHLKWSDFELFMVGQTMTEKDGETYFFTDDVSRFVYSKCNIYHK